MDIEPEQICLSLSFLKRINKKANKIRNEYIDANQDEEKETVQQFLFT